MIAPPLIVDGAAPGVLPACYLQGQARSGRVLFVTQVEIWLLTRDGWIRIPRGYVTDFGSIPGLVQIVTLLGLQPLGHHAWAALGHDWGYAVGQPGWRPKVDHWFDDRMRVDQVGPLARELMYRSVRIGGGGGYKKAPSWWDTQNFADPVTGRPVPPPFRREEAFAGGPHGLRPLPDWPLL
jgi:hypothetical protein